MAQNSLDNLPEAQERDSLFEDVDFEEVEEKLNKEFEEGTGKPYLETNTNAVVDGAVLKRSTQPKTDSKGKEYYDNILTIKTVMSDGRESFDNYSGLREYPDGYWNGQKSAFGRLQGLMKDEFGIKNYREMIQKLHGAKVKIKTEKTTFDGQEYQKNMIQSFR